MTAIHAVTSLTGSLVLGLAVFNGRLTPLEAWEISRIDETWQNEQWGEDEEAAEFEAVRRSGLLHAARFCQLCR